MRAKGLRILLIDDDQDDCGFFREAVNEIDTSHMLICGRNSEQLFGYVETANPDLIFMDINMPGTNGIHSLKRLKAHPIFNSIPVIMYSVSSDLRDKEECFNAGAHHYIVKPYVHSNLVNTLRKVFSTDWKHRHLPKREGFVIDLTFA